MKCVIIIINSTVIITFTKEYSILRWEAELCADDLRNLVVHVGRTETEPDAVVEVLGTSLVRVGAIHQAHVTWGPCKDMSVSIGGSTLDLTTASAIA